MALAQRDVYLLLRGLLPGGFVQGDVLLFGHHTVHWALPNPSDNRLRLSMDFRYGFGEGL